jgi:hypothetical protein
VRLDARQLSGEHARQGASHVTATGDYYSGKMTLLAPGLTHAICPHVEGISERPSFSGRVTYKNPSCSLT